MAQTTIKHWFNRFELATGQKVTHVQMYAESDWDWEYKCERYSDDYRDDAHLPREILWEGIAARDQLFTYEEVPKEILNYKFDDGFGSADAPPIIAFSRDYVLYVHEYDGAESLHWLPRFPVAPTSPVV